jgi:hypothetical protein
MLFAGAPRYMAAKKNIAAPVPPRHRHYGPHLHSTVEHACTKYVQARLVASLGLLGGKLTGQHGLEIGCPVHTQHSVDQNLFVNILRIKWENGLVSHAVDQG